MTTDTCPQGRELCDGSSEAPFAGYDKGVCTHSVEGPHHTDGSPCQCKDRRSYPWTRRPVYVKHLDPHDDNPPPPEKIEHRAPGQVTDRRVEERRKGVSTLVCNGCGGAYRPTGAVVCACGEPLRVDTRYAISDRRKAQPPESGIVERIGKCVARCESEIDRSRVSDETADELASAVVLLKMAAAHIEGLEAELFVKRAALNAYGEVLIKDGAENQRLREAVEHLRICDGSPRIHVTTAAGTKAYGDPCPHPAHKEQP